MSKILVIDDAPDVHFILREAFLPDHQVISAMTISEAAGFIRNDKFDLVILDVKLPDGDGFKFCASLQLNGATKATPVFFLIGKSELTDKSMGFSLGAEDYIVKPFDATEVRLRCEARLRKIAGQRTQKSIINCGNIRIESTSQKVYLVVDNQETMLNFTPNGFKLLNYFLSHLDQVFSRDQLITAVWGKNIHIVDRTVDTHIAAIRTQLKQSGIKIHSVHGVGYRVSVDDTAKKQIAA